MEILLLLIQIPLLVVIIKRLREIHSDEFLKKYYYYLVSFKVTAGLLLGIIYYNYYQLGDTVDYFTELTLYQKLFGDDPIKYLRFIFLNEFPENLLNVSYYAEQPRVLFFLRMVSPLHLLTGGNYWLLSIYLSIFSFAGFWILSNTLMKIYKVGKTAVLISFFLFPSVVFWSSGMIKESVTMGAMTLLISFLLKSLNDYKDITVIKIIMASFMTLIILQLKFYYLAILLAILIPYMIVKFFEKKITNKTTQVSLLVILIISMAYVATFTHPLISISSFAEILHLNYNSTLDNSKYINVYLFEGLSKEPLSFIPHIPKALIYGLFGPFLWHCKKIIMLFTGIENTAILILFITFIASSFKKERLKNFNIEALSLIIYIFFLALLMAFASPNWGSLMRYKIGFLPFFLLLMLHKNYYIDRLVEPLKKSSFFKQ